MIKELDFTQAPNLAELEEQVIKFWDEEHIFEKSLEKNLSEKDRNKGESESKDDENSKEKTYIFYDGPPFATGLPHYGHLLASTTKDLLPRYQTMRGKYVPRRWGWDCHGLPIENLVEKELGLGDRKSIEEYGVAKFNEACRAKVMEYRDEWQRIIHRFGRFVDMENDYKTMDLEYMEGLWKVFKGLWDRGLIYHGFKSMHYCPHCGTPLSNFEVTQGYKDVKDLSAIVEFWLKKDEKWQAVFGELGLADGARIAALAWTTTPWTLPGNMLLAVGAEVEYWLVEGNEKNAAGENDYFLVAEELAAAVFETEVSELKVVAKYRGEDLVDLRYTPPFDFILQKLANNSEEIKKVMTIKAGDFVTIEDGTGIVHIAPAFGEDDYNLGRQIGLSVIKHVDEGGHFVIGVGEGLDGRMVKPKDDPQETDVEVIKYLAHHDTLFSKKKYEHSYPFCWRCDYPLLNYATDSWFVEVTKFKDQLVANNQKINWVPEHIKSGRFGKWLEGARDWAISRNRFWGTPLPVWVNEEDENDYLCVGSKEELEKLSGQKFTDLHKHFLDEVVIYKDGATYRKIPEVLDCWFESGSMPYASGRRLPADFISEGQDQTRGWFYTLHVLATALTAEIKESGQPILRNDDWDRNGTPAFKNCIVSGIILAEDGKKMSKKLKNYPDPELIFEKYGVDAMRLYLMSSPVVKAEALNFSEKEVADWRRKFFVILWNVLGFYLTAAENDRRDDDVVDLEAVELDILDSWILARTAELVSETTTALESYDLVKYGRVLSDFNQDLSTWYLRLSRERLKEANGAAESGRRVFGEVLATFAKVLAPGAPFFAEVIHQALKENELSVHLADWPELEVWVKRENQNLLRDMEQLRAIVEMIHAERKKLGLKVRQPLSEVRIKTGKKWQYREAVTAYLLQEVNVKQVVWREAGEGENDEIELETKLTPKLVAEGVAREMMRQIAQIRKERKMTVDELLTYEVDQIPEGWQEAIEKKTNTKLQVVDK